jgi:hypothetical protein
LLTFTIPSSICFCPKLQFATNLLIPTENNFSNKLNFFFVGGRVDSVIENYKKNAGNYVKNADYNGKYFLVKKTLC